MGTHVPGLRATGPPRAHDGQNVWAGKGVGAGLAPVSVAPQDSLDANHGFFQGLAPLYLQQSILVILEQERAHHIAATLHPTPPPEARALSLEVRLLKRFPHVLLRGEGAFRLTLIWLRDASYNYKPLAPIQELPILALSSH